MFKNYLKLTFRNLFKNKLHSFINMMGLTIGLSATLCIIIYLQNELQQDNFHQHKDQLYRIGMKSFRQGSVLTDGHIFTPPIGPAMKEELAGVENYTRYSTSREAYFSIEQNALKIEKLCYADSTFFSLFSFPALEGDPTQSLVRPYSLVLTESTANRLFGSSEVLGKTVRLNNSKDLQITAVIADLPATSHIKFEALVSFSTLYQNPENHMGWNGGGQYITYVKLDQKTNPATVEQQFPTFLWRHINEKYAAFNLRLEANLQALPNIHFYHNPYSASLRTNLYIIGAMALLILVIACINFINLSTARAGRRAREVGVRKVLGATQAALRWQFLGEAFLLTSIAFVVSLLLVEAAVPLLPHIFGMSIDVTAFFNWTSIGGLFLLLLFVGICAGLYPAMHLAAFETAKTLKGRPSKSGGSGFRKGLMVFQFIVSTILIISTLVISEQLSFTNAKSLGFDKENVLVLPLLGEEIQEKIDLLKQSLKKTPKVLASAACSQPPGKGFTQNGYRPEEIEEPMLIKVVDVDDDYFKVFDLEMVEGRQLSIDKAGDQQAYLINETLAKQLDWQNAIGKNIRRDGDHQVIGVVKDFHFASLYQPIEPLIITCTPLQGRFDFLAVKLAKGDLNQGVQAVQQAWKSVFPDVPMDYWFLDDSITQLYYSEQRLKDAFLGCSSLAIFIALMGIWGLLTYSVEQRKKEIGIRKVLGASVVGIVKMLSTDFIKLILIALFIASPLAYYFMDKWLADFAYRINMQWWMFIVAGIATLVIALVTVGVQSIKAALANPIQALRSD